jgi:hypothetical protein
VSYEAQNEMKHVEITPAMDEIDRQVLHGTLPDYELFEGEAEKIVLHGAPSRSRTPARVCLETCN